MHIDKGVAADQFGRRAFNYYVKFVNDSSAVEEVIKASIKIKVIRSLISSYYWICEVIKRILKEHKDITIVGTLLFDDLRSSVMTLPELSTTISLVYGVISDIKDAKIVNKHLNLCRKISPLSRFSSA